jgi:hypothetical protein
MSVKKLHLSERLFFKCKLTKTINDIKISQRKLFYLFILGMCNIPHSKLPN